MVHNPSPHPRSVGSTPPILIKYVNVECELENEMH